MLFLKDMEGIIATVDFGIQSSDTSMGRINTVGGLVNRDIPWILRNFGEFGLKLIKVFLDSSRRNYLEYKFGTVKSLNSYNKALGKIPYYIWIGCDKSKSHTILERLNCLATESLTLLQLQLQSLINLKIFQFLKVMKLL